MALSIEESVQVATSPGVVWKLLSDPRTWMLWWPSCLEAEALDKKLLRDGSKLRLVLQPSFLRFGVTATVEVATADRALLWRGAAWGVEGRHAFYLECLEIRRRVLERLLDRELERDRRGRAVRAASLQADSRHPVGQRQQLDVAAV